MENLFEFDGAVSLDKKIQANEPNEENLNNEVQDSVKEDNQESVLDVISEDKVSENESNDAYNPHFQENVELKNNDESLNEVEDGEMSPASVFYNYLVEQNHLSELENFDGSEESLSKALETLPEKIFSESVSKMSKDAQDLLSYAFNKSGNVTND